MTLLMTAWSDVKVPGDSLHCPACYSQSREGFPGRAGRARSQGERGLEARGWVVGTRWAGRGVLKWGSFPYYSEIISQLPGVSWGWGSVFMSGITLSASGVLSLGSRVGDPASCPAPALYISRTAGCSQERESRSSQREELSLSCTWL